MRTILVPFDFSPYARRGLRLALRGIPFGPDTRVELLHVIDPALYEHVLPHRPRPSGDAMHAHLKDAVTAARIGVDDRLNIEVTTTTVEGSPFEQITAHAATCDGVVIGGQGHGGWREKFLGRTANRLSERIKVPTYIVKVPEASATASVVCAVDFSASAKTVLRAARDLARSAGGDLVVTHIVEAMPPDLTEFDHALQRQNVEAARQKLIAEEQQALGETYSRSQLCFAGSSVRKIVDVAALYDASCIVVGRNSHPSIGHVVLGSVASRLLHAATMDIFVIPLG